MSPTAARKLLRLLATASLAGTSIFVGGLVAEGILRVRGVVYGLVTPHPNPDLKFTLKPGLRGLVRGVEHAHNSRGLRDREYPDAPPHGVTRVIVIGDSIAYGQGISQDKILAGRLEASLDALKGDHSFEVLNAGVGGYNACQEEAFLKEVGFTYQPTVIVWQYCLNDIDNTWDPFGADEQQGFLPIPAKWKRGLREHVLLWNFMRVQSYGLLHLLGFMSTDTSREDYARYIFSLYGDLERERRDHAWACIRRAKEAVAQRGGQMLVAVFPFAMQAAGDPTFTTEPQRDIGERCRKAGVPCLDLLPIFERGGAWDLYERPDFVHLSEKGHQVAAEAIARELIGSLQSAGLNRVAELPISP